jgi:hypothetical protein
MTRPWKPPVDVPAVITAAGDPNRHLARWKASLVRRWSLTRMHELLETLFAGRPLYPAFAGTDHIASG